jgi:hypothetical protein
VNADAAGRSAADPVDVAVAAAQLGRPVRGMLGVAHRCPCGSPDVIVTAPRLDDGTPFPTTFYLTCPRAASAIGTLEASGLMREMTRRLAEDPPWAAAYRAAHEDYLRRRAAFGEVSEIAGVSAGGMPDRVKCLHVLVGHALAAGPGVNPLGDEALAALGEWWADGPCVDAEAGAGARNRAECHEDAHLRDGFNYGT